MSQDNIQVAIRIRPLIKSEKERNLKVQWTIQKNNIFQIDENGQRISEPYSFDHIFQMDKTNSSIYTDIVNNFVESSLNGLNSTIFAYGQTSSGKTYTMLGDDKDPGVMSLAIDSIFKRIDDHPSRQFLLRVSYIEIYNEKINDLLDLNNKDIRIRELLTGNIILQDVKEEIVTTPDEVYECLRIGTLNRRIAETNMNERSSRSHTIFRILIESTEKYESEGSVQISNLNLVDLAGSERVAQTKATGVRLKEGGHINKSLSALSLVIKQLSDCQEFVNFRDSKLTRLLQHSLGGNAKTLIIATITLASVEDTHSTLSFAQRAKTVKNKPHINEIPTEASLNKRYAKLNEQLNKKLEEQLKINEEGSKEIRRLQKQLKIIANFPCGENKFVDIVSNVPKRRHTVGFSGQKPFLKAISEEPENVSPVKELLPTLPTSEFSTPKSTLRERIRSLENDYEELTTFTRYEKMCLENSEAMKNLEDKLQFYEKKSNQQAKDLERYRVFEKKYNELQKQVIRDGEFLTNQLSNKFKLREQELLNRIEEIENKKNKSTPNVSIEVEDLKEQLMTLQSILANEKSVDPLIEKFNVKLESSKNIVRNEIVKQIKSFNQNNNESIALPNELESFNELLKEFADFETEYLNESLSNEIDVIVDQKRDINNFKLLISIYEALLKKNDFIGRCSEKIISLQDKIKGFDEEIVHLNATVDQLNLSVIEKDKIINSLRVSLDENDNNIENYEKKLKQIADEVNEIKSNFALDLEKKDFQLNEMKNDLDSFVSRLKAKDDELSAVNEIKIKLEEEVENWSARYETALTEMKEHREEKEAELNRCQATNKLLESTVAELRNNLEKSKENYEIKLREMKSEAELVSGVQNLNGSSDDWCSRFERAEAELNRRQEVIEELERMMAELHNSLESAKIENNNNVESYEEKLKQIANETSDIKSNFALDLEKKDSQLNEMKNDLETFVSRLRVKERELSAVSEIKDKLEAEVKNWSTRYETVLTEMKQYREEKETEINRCQETNKLLEGTVAELRDEVAQSRVAEEDKIISEKQASQIVKMESEIDDLVTKLKTKDEELLTVSKIKGELELEVDNLKALSDDWCSRYQQTEAELSRHREIVEELERTVAELRNSLESAKSYEMKLIQLENERDFQIVELRKKDEELVATNKIKETLEVEVKDLCDRHELSLVELKQRMDELNHCKEMNKQLEHTITNLRNELMSLPSNGQLEELKNALGEKEKTILELDLQFAQMKREVDKYLAELKRKDEINQQLQAEVDRLTISSQSALAELNRRQESNQTQPNSNKNVKILQDELDELKYTLLEKNNAITNLGNANVRFEKFVCNILEQVIKENKTLLLERSSQELRDYLKEIRKYLKAVNGDLRNLLHQSQEQDVYDLDEIYRKLFQTNEIVKQYTSSERTFLQSKIEQLESSTKSYLDEIKNLRGTHQDSSECLALRSKIVELNRQIKDQSKELVDLRLKLYEKSDQESKGDSGSMLQCYNIRIKCLEQKLEECRKKVETNTSSVQCDLLGGDAYDKLQRKYENLKLYCVKYKKGRQDFWNKLGRS